MASEALLQRLEGIQGMLVGAHKAGVGLSAASKGYERQQLIDGFLSRVLPPSYRFGQGEVIDRAGNQTGQLDVVIEFPLLPSIPLAAEPSARLYLAEGIAAVVEVKSDLATQWSEACDTARRLSAVRRSLRSRIGSYERKGFDPAVIPIFVVGYSGWAEVATLRSHLQDAPIAGALVIEKGVFASIDSYGGASLTGPASLWGLVSALYTSVRWLAGAYVDIEAYGFGPE